MSGSGVNSGCEPWRMNCVTGKPRLGDVAVKGPVGDRAFGGHQVHACLVLEPLAEVRGAAESPSRLMPRARLASR